MAYGRERRACRSVVPDSAAVKMLVCSVPGPNREPAAGVEKGRAVLPGSVLLDFLNSS